MDAQQENQKLKYEADLAKVKSQIEEEFDLNKKTLELKFKQAMEEQIAKQRKD